MGPLDEMSSIHGSISQKVFAIFEYPLVPEDLEGPQKTKLVGEVIGFHVLIKIPERFSTFQTIAEPAKEEVERIGAKLEG